MQVGEQREQRTPQRVRVAVVPPRGKTWERSVWRAGALVFGRDEVDDHIPSLRSRAPRHGAPPAPVATADATTAATRT